MLYSYRGFDVELNTSTDTPESRGLWGFEIYGANHNNVYGQQDKYQTSGDAAFEAGKWIDNHLRWTPMNQTSKQAVAFQEVVKELEEQLKKITNSDYYKQLTSSGFYAVEVNLDDALQSVIETMQVNERVIEIMKAHPEDEMKSAIAKYLETQTGEESIADLEPYL